MIYGVGKEKKMTRRLYRLALIASFCFSYLLVPSVARAQLGVEAQFGKNKVHWEDAPKNYYRSEHFDIYHSMDLNDESQKKHFMDVVNHLEASYSWLSKKYDHDLKERVPVVSYRTHSLFEANYIEPDFMPEGVGAFAEPMRNRLVIKADFLPPLNRTIITHELDHIFQFSVMNLNIFSMLTGGIKRPVWFIEGGADWAANSFSPYTRDDIRKLEQRGAAANPEKNLPTWFDLEEEHGNPYTMGAMVFQFLEGKLGPEKIWQFNKMGLKEHSRPLVDILEELTDGEINSPEKFDQMHRDYWAAKYAKEMLDKPRPYQETVNFKSRAIAPKGFPYPTVSGVPSPNGQEIASFSIQKNGLALIVTPILENKPYVQKTKKRALFVKVDFEPKIKPRNLTKSFPPIPWEYPVVQLLDEWPFNGSDLDWSPDGSKIAFFARKGRDHVLFVIDSQNGKILNEVEIHLDQAFSPVFSGEKLVFFSAAKNVTRNIYAVSIGSPELGVIKITDGQFDTAPTISLDGTKMAFIRFVGDFQKLFLQDLTTGEIKQLTYGRYNDNSPSFSKDGETILFTSDNDSGVWNLYSIELKDTMIRQWTNFFGGVFTPKFASGSKDTVYYTAYWQYDQFNNTIYPNFRLYEAILKEPVKEFCEVHKQSESMEWAFRSEKLFKANLDENQIFNPEKRPNKWKLNGHFAYAGYSTYYGAYSYTAMSISDILEEKNHLIRFATSGSDFRLIDYNYFDVSKHLNWGFSAYDQKLPMYYIYYDIVKQSPNQVILNNTLMEQMGVGLTASYPLDKFNRFESGIRLKRKSFDLLGYDSQSVALNPDSFNSTDLGLTRLFEDANGSSVSLFGAYVRDTVLYSQNTQGQFVGNAFRAQLEYAPPVPGSFLTYTAAIVDGRKYIPLSRGSLLALRGTGLWSTDRSGDFMLMGGTDVIHGYPYGSLVGNQAVYTSAELRFPLVDAVIFAPGVPIGPLRGLMFADYGVARFTKEDFPVQKGIAYGLGFQLNMFAPFNFTWSKNNLDGYNQWKYDFYIKMNW